jgi:hypothetical protein
MTRPDSDDADVRLRRFLPRRVIWTLACVALLLAVRLVWGHYTAAAVREQVKQIRVRGEPMELADFRFEQLPDSENAAKYQLDAANAFVRTAIPPRASNNIYTPYPPYDAKWMADAAASEQAHGTLFALAREARRHSHGRWPSSQPPTSVTAAAMRMGPFNLARNLANTLGDGAEYAHLTGNDPEALERVRDIFDVARSCRVDDTIIAQLVGIGIDALATSATLSIAPGLRVKLGDPNAPATRAAAQALIAELLDDEPIRRGIQRSFIFERAMTHETRKIAASRTWVIRPLADAQLLRDDRNFEIEIAASVLANKPQVMAALARTTAEHPLELGSITPKQYRDVPRYSRWFGSPWYFDRYFETSFRVRAERRIAAVSLAAQTVPRGSPALADDAGRARATVPPGGPDRSVRRWRAAQLRRQTRRPPRRRRSPARVLSIRRRQLRAVPRAVVRLGERPPARREDPAGPVAVSRPRTLHPRDPARRQRRLSMTSHKNPAHQGTSTHQRSSVANHNTRSPAAPATPVNTPACRTRASHLPVRANVASSATNPIPPAAKMRSTLRVGDTALKFPPCSSTAIARNMSTHGRSSASGAAHRARWPRRVGSERQSPRACGTTTAPRAAARGRTSARPSPGPARV